VVTEHSTSVWYNLLEKRPHLRRASFIREITILLVTKFPKQLSPLCRQQANNCVKNHDICTVKLRFMTLCPASKQEKLVFVLPVLTEEAICGCPQFNQCECNTRLCSPPPDCGNCSHVFEVKSKNSSQGGACDNCCPTYECHADNCTREMPTPEGYMYIHEDGRCCPRLYCYSCRLSNGSYKEV